jgi:hypothetical protein
MWTSPGQPAAVAKSETTAGLISFTQRMNAELGINFTKPMHVVRQDL